MVRYLAAYHRYFWQWEDDGEVLAIPDGSTIAYRQTIIEVIEYFKGDPLPRFGHLLMAVIATNNSMTDDVDTLGVIIRDLIRQDHTDRRKELLILLDEAISFLKTLSGVPDRYKHGDGRKVLLRGIFEKGHKKVAARRISQVLKTLESQEYSPMPAGIKAIIPAHELLADLRPMALLGRHYPTPDDIIKGLATVPDVPSPELEDDGLPQQGATPSLLDQLIENQKTFHVAALIQRFWSGLHIPYHLSLPSGQPLGGVSDLTNKGGFDRLLLSEFANEEVVLMSRLANNEALYFRREEPPADEEFERIILIDISLKNWGTPKLLAHAIMMAIGNHPKTDIKCTGYAVGRQVHPLHFETVQGVIDGLSWVDPGLHAAEGLAEFLKQHRTNKQSEVFFISSQEAVKQAEMQNLLNEYHGLFRYWISVSPDGKVHVYKNHYKTKRLIQELQLPLQELWQQRKPTTPLSDHQISASQPFPILAPKSLNYIAHLTLDADTGYVITRTKMLTRLRHKHNKGLECISELPYASKNCHFEIGRINENIYLLTFSPSRKKLYCLNLHTMEEQEHPCKNFFFPSAYPTIFVHDEKFYKIDDHWHWEISCVPELKIEKNFGVPEELKEAFKNRQIEKNSISYHADNVLTNLKSVYINSVNNLVLNGRHELRIKNDRQLLLLQTEFKRPAMVASYHVEHKQYIFPDGSAIHVDKWGVLHFRSSNEVIQKFYIPTALEKPLAIATSKYFAGDPYFFNDRSDNPLEKTSLKRNYECNLESFIRHIQYQS